MLNLSPALQARFRQAAFWLLALSVLLLPIGLGGARTLPFGLTQLGLGLFYICHALGHGNDEISASFPRRLGIALGLFALVAIWAWLQNQTFTPAAWHHPLWRDAGDVLGRQLPGAISLAPDAGMNALARFVTFVLAGIGIYLVARDPAQAERLVTMFWCTGVAVCAYGLLLMLCDTQSILWFKKWAYRDDMTATFVNRNQFADYAGLTLLTGIGLCWRSLRRVLTGMQSHQRAALFQGWLTSTGLYYATAILVVTLCLLLSHSRAGLAATLLGLAVFIAGYLLQQRRTAAAISVPVGAALVVAAVVILLPDMGRFATLFSDWSSRDRLSAMHQTQQAIMANPLLGHGLGSFAVAFELYRDRTLSLVFTHAHSDWLEAAFELGLPAAALLYTGILLCVSGCWHGIRVRRQHGLYAALGLGASALVLSHALVDFGMQIPGLVVSWLLLLCVGLAQGWSSRKA